MTKQDTTPHVLAWRDDKAPKCWYIPTHIAARTWRGPYRPEVIDAHAASEFGPDVIVTWTTVNGPHKGRG